jgi:hypothetical protein
MMPSLRTVALALALLGLALVARPADAHGFLMEPIGRQVRARPRRPHGAEGLFSCRACNAPGPARFGAGAARAPRHLSRMCAALTIRQRAKQPPRPRSFITTCSTSTTTRTARVSDRAGRARRAQHAATAPPVAPCPRALSAARQRRRRGPGGRRAPWRTGSRPSAPARPDRPRAACNCVQVALVGPRSSAAARAGRAPPATASAAIPSARPSSTRPAP